jgi:uncharacterized iron-regulated membrane protein
MNAARLSRNGHKWLALVVGVQLLLWAISGFYMVVVDLDFIHGDPLVRNLTPELRIARPIVPPDRLRSGRPPITAMHLRALPDDGAPVYEIVTTAGSELVDAHSGERISPISPARIRDLARAYYAGDGAIERVNLLTNAADKPTELQTAPLPLWRVDFDDWLETSLYLQPDTGRLVTRRHRFWRWFDFLWSLHIMDYQDRTDVNNWLLRIATALGLTTAISGLWLTFFSFGFLQRRKTRRAPS